MSCFSTLSNIVAKSLMAAFGMQVAKRSWWLHRLVRADESANVETEYSSRLRAASKTLAGIRIGAFGAMRLGPKTVHLGQKRVAQHMLGIA